MTRLQHRRPIAQAHGADPHRRRGAVVRHPASVAPGPGIAGGIARRIRLGRTGSRGLRASASRMDSEVPAGLSTIVATVPPRQGTPASPSARDRQPPLLLCMHAPASRTDADRHVQPGQTAASRPDVGGAHFAVQGEQQIPAQGLCLLVGGLRDSALVLSWGWRRSPGRYRQKESAGSPRLATPAYPFPPTRLHRCVVAFGSAATPLPVNDSRMSPCPPPNPPTSPPAPPP